MRNRHLVGMVIDTGDPEQTNPFCPRCEKMGEISRLKENIYLDDKTGKLLVPQPPDADNFLQCWKCNVVIPIRETKMQGKISGISGIEPIDNPFDFKKGTILGVDDRKKRYRKLKKTQAKYPVQKLIDDGYKLKSYQQNIPN